MEGNCLTDVQLDGYHNWRKQNCTQTENEAHRNPLAVWFEYGKKAEGDARPDYWACDQVVEMYEQMLDLHEYLQEMEHNGNPSTMRWWSTLTIV